MMDISSYSRRDVSWQPRLQADDRDRLLEEMLARLCTDAFFAVNEELSLKGILQALIERETLRSTAMGDDIAFPHARLENLDHTLFAVATLEEPVLFGDQPVRIVCMILVPANEPSISLKLMAHFARILSSEQTRSQVLQAASPQQLESFFSQSDLNIDRPICARDIMRLPRWSVFEDTPVSECARMMSNYQLRTVPVLNGQKQIVGEITVEHLFLYGLPDFFTRLKSVSFVAEFDPFEKYFEDERRMNVGELMSREPRTVSPDHTLMEIVFDLAVRQCSKLYVVNEKGRWIGTVAKGTILDNVINN